MPTQEADINNKIAFVEELDEDIDVTVRTGQGGDGGAGGERTWRYGQGKEEMTGQPLMLGDFFILNIKKWPPTLKKLFVLANMGN